ncbi:MAG: hypothetical protein NXI32_10960 [bacterium]|nr:hypothetical protein [bacterium]
MSQNDSTARPDEKQAEKTIAVERVVSIDVFRGMVMFLMLAEIMHLYDLAEAYPGVTWLEWLRFHTTHVAWEGCSLHDLIQPGFTFLVGVAMPFSIASRLRRGGPTWKLVAHAALRSVILIALGIVLRSMGREQTYFTFEDTLTQIGLGYFPVFCIALWLPPRGQLVALLLVLVGFWGLYAASPAPAPDFDYPAVGVPADWPHHHSGFASRFNKNSNVSWQFDTWFLNLFPREKPFEFNSGGYATLSFVPTMGTMLMGLIAGTWLKQVPTFRGRMLRLVGMGLLGILLASGLAWTDVCPLVKRIWTPTFALYSGGWCLLWLASLHAICDHGRFKSWALPLIVIGANSILIYVMSWTVADPVRDMLFRHFGRETFAVFGESLTRVTSGATTMLVLFYVLWWLYRRRVFIKI